MQQKERNKYWDVIKGIAIIFMVLGHSIEYGGGQVYRDSGMQYDNMLFQLIYSFHMPLFMLVAGYFFYKTEQHHSTREILKRKCNQLLVPILSFSLINFALKFSRGWGLIGGIKVFLQTFSGTLWFLWVLLVIVMIQLLLNNIKIEKWILNLVVMLALYFLPNKWHFAELAYMYPFFLMGYYLDQTRFVHNETKNLGWKTLASVVLFAFLFHFYSRKVLIYESGTCLISSGDFNAQLWIDVYRVLIGVLGCASILYLVKWLMGFWGGKSKVFVLLSKVGVLSMGIYCFQDSVLCIYHHFTRSIAEPTFWWWALAFVVIFTLCLVATIISKKVKFLNTCLLGGR